MKGAGVYSRGAAFGGEASQTLNVWTFLRSARSPGFDHRGTASRHQPIPSARAPARRRRGSPTTLLPSDESDAAGIRPPERPSRSPSRGYSARANPSRGFARNLTAPIHEPRVGDAAAIWRPHRVVVLPAPVANGVNRYAPGSIARRVQSTEPLPGRLPPARAAAQGRQQPPCARRTSTAPVAAAVDASGHGLERECEIVRRLKTVGRGLLEAAADDSLERGRHAGSAATRADLRAESPTSIGRRIAAKRRSTGEHLEQHRAETENVGPGVRRHSTHLLRVTYSRSSRRMMPASVNGGSVPASVSPARPVISLARPKSRILTRPSVVTKTFSGFRSRWTMPLVCAAARPRAIGTATRGRAYSQRAGRTACRRVSPSSSSETMNGAPSCMPMSKTTQILGWLRAAAV